MVLKRSWQFGVCLGALLLLAGTALAAEQGYWKQQGDLEYWNKKLPPLGPASATYASSSEGCTGTIETSIDRANTCKVRFIRTIRQKLRNVDRILARTVNDFTWTPPPAVMIPGQVIPASGRVEVVQATGDPGGGALYCHVQLPRKADGSPGGVLADVFAGLDKGGHSKTAAHWEFTNPKCSIGKGAKGQTVYLVFIAQGAWCPETLQVATPYVWAEGVPPALPPPPPLPPIVVTPEPIPPTPTPPPVPTPPVPPKAVGGSLEGTWKINQNNYTGLIEFSRTAAGWTGRIYFDFHRKWEPLGSIAFNETNGQVTFIRTDHNQRHVGTLKNNSIGGQFESAGVTYRWDATRSDVPPTVPPGR